MNEPLFLTKEMKNEGIVIAKKKSFVNLPIELGVESYSGFFTTNDQDGNHLFFWYFEVKFVNIIRILPLVNIFL